MKSAGTAVIAIILGLISVTVGLIWPRLQTDPPASQVYDYTPGPLGMRLIAHAGGGLPYGIYSNSIKATELAVDNAFDLIEIDFSLTTDGQLVAIHDWEDSYRYWFDLPFIDQFKVLIGQPPTVPDHATFMAMSMQYGQEQADLAAIMAWLAAHPDVRIVTDVKGDNLEALTLIAETYPTLLPQIVPQIYAPEEYAPVVNLGWTDIIFTIYRSQLTPEEIATFASSVPLYALTVPYRVIINDRYATLLDLPVPVFVHTINTPRFATELQGIGVAGLYTDYLIPAVNTD